MWSSLALTFQLLTFELIYSIPSAVLTCIYWISCWSSLWQQSAHINRDNRAARYNYCKSHAINKRSSAWRWMESGCSVCVLSWRLRRLAGRSRRRLLNYSRVLIRDERGARTYVRILALLIQGVHAPLIICISFVNSKWPPGAFNFSSSRELRSWHLELYSYARSWWNNNALWTHLLKSLRQNFGALRRVGRDVCLLIFQRTKNFLCACVGRSWN